MELDDNEFQGLYSKKIGLQFPITIGSVRFNFRLMEGRWYCTTLTSTLEGYQEHSRHAVPFLSGTSNFSLLKTAVLKFVRRLNEDKNITCNMEDIR